MTLRDFKNEINNIKESLLDIEVVMKAENGLLFEPHVRFVRKDDGSLQLDSENIDKAIITIF